MAYTFRVLSSATLFIFKQPSGMPSRFLQACAGLAPATLLAHFDAIDLLAAISLQADSHFHYFTSTSPSPLAGFWPCRAILAAARPPACPPITSNSPSRPRYDSHIAAAHYTAGRAPSRHHSQPLPVTIRPAATQAPTYGVNSHLVRILGRRKISPTRFLGQYYYYSREGYFH